MRHDIYPILLVFALSLVVASLAFKPILAFARKYKFYDKPNERKLQRTPVPVMGGFVVFIGTVIGLLCYMFIRDVTPLLPVVAAMLVMLVVGAYDDVRDVSATKKLCIEIAVVVALAIVNGYGINDFHGLWGIHDISPWIAWPLTVLASVGIINAINMIDGINGLSSGICIMAFGFYGLFFFYSHDFVHTALAVAIVGALIPFFIMNVFGERSKMFIGDAGTMMLGVVLCDMVVTMLAKDSMCDKQIRHTNFCLFAFALAVLAIPVFDTLRVMLGRICRGESPFSADKTHLHHAFIDYGFHHLETALMEIILNMIVIGFWWFIYKSHLSEQWQLYGVIAAAIAVCFGLYYMLGRRRRIAKRVKEKYGVSIIEFERMTNEEKRQLIEKKSLEDQRLGSTTKPVCTE